MRDCWIVKKVICKYYFAIPNSRVNPGFKTVKVFISNLKSSYIYENDSDDEYESDEENLVENTKLIDTFEEEYRSYISLETIGSDICKTSAKNSGSSDHSEGLDLKVHLSTVLSKGSDDSNLSDSSQVNSNSLLVSACNKDTPQFHDNKLIYFLNIVFIMILFVNQMKASCFQFSRV